MYILGMYYTHTPTPTYTQTSIHTHTYIYSLTDILGSPTQIMPWSILILAVSGYQWTMVGVHTVRSLGILLSGR